jgi:hypothetical protein
LETSSPPFPVIYFDAFENDYVEDAFAALAREVLMLLEEKSLDDELQSFKNRAVACGTILLKAGARLTARIAVRAATGGLAGVSDLSDIRGDLEQEAADATTAMIANLLEGPKQQKAAIENFRQALARLPQVLSHGVDERRPLIFIIDELDRCRPAFALSLLERIKHFMSVPNVHFVLGVHMKQLCNSVRSVYGPEIDASMYLQKFIALSVSMESKHELRRNGNQAKYVEYLLKNLSLQTTAVGKIEHCRDTLIRIATDNNFSLRTIERIFTLLVLSATFTLDRRLFLPRVITGLCCLRIMKPEFYDMAKAKQLAFKDVERFFALEMGRLQSSPLRHERQEWMGFLDGEPIQNKELSVYLVTHDIQPEDLIPLIAREVVDRLGP